MLTNLAVRRHVLFKQPTPNSEEASMAGAGRVAEPKIST